MFRKGQKGKETYASIGIERLKISIFPLFGRNSECKFSDSS